VTRRLQSFPPVAARDARVLILGTMPGVKSLEANEYYAHPRNAFWPIMAELIGLDLSAPYAKRTHALKARGLALWDVVAACVRPGSLDADISEAEPHDFAPFFAAHKKLERIAFNGATSEKLFHRYAEAPNGVELVLLPSTSPAHASRSFAQKCEAWRIGLGL